MATQTKPSAEFTDTDGTTCMFEYDYDDVSFLVIAVRCINNTTQSAYGWVARSTNYNVNYSSTFPPLTNTEFSVSQGAANRLQLTVTPSGKLDGIEVSYRFPALV